MRTGVWSIFLSFFFLMCTILKLLIEFMSTLLLFYVFFHFFVCLFVCFLAKRRLGPGCEPELPAWEGDVLIPGPPGKSWGPGLIITFFPVLSSCLAKSVLGPHINELINELMN